MPQYDGSIRINTQINVKSAEAQLGALEISISKSASKIAELRSKLDSLKTAQIPTQEYSDISAHIEKARHSLDGLLEKQDRMQAEGKTSGAAWERINIQIAETRSEINYAKGELLALVDAGKAFTVGDPAQEEKLTQHLQTEEARLSSMTQKRDILNSKVHAAFEEEKRLVAIKESSTVADQKLVDLLERRRQLLTQIKDFEKAGVTEGYTEYDNALADLSDVQGQINGVRNMRDAAAQARASYVGLGESVKQSFKTMARGLVDIPIAAVKSGVRGLASNFQKLGGIVKNVAVKSFRLLGNAIKSSLSKIGSLIGTAVSKMRLLGSVAKKSFSTVNNSAKKSGGIFSNFSSRLKGIVSSLLIFNWITKAFNAVVKSIKDGFGNLYKDNEQFKTSVDNLHASVLTLKNAFAAAFRPLVDVAIPYIQMAADKLTELLAKVGQFTAAITGQATYTKAIKQTADAFKDAKKSAEGYLSPLDEINKFSSKTNGEDEEQTGIMFEEVPIDQKFKDMAQKVKDVFKDLFSPIKEAWGHEGQFVIDSWEYGLGEVWKLIKDIGRDFLKVWKQPATVAMLQDILHIFGDIGLIIGNLAAKFREAWNANNVGLHILENIRDIFSVIIHNIREAADYTVEWSKTIDFTPLLQGIERLTASLVPFFDFLSGTLVDFYTQFLLPLASWALSEDGIPRLLNILADFMESVNWEELREALSSLYSALEPYAETVGTGLIDFVERMKEYGVEFFNFLPEHINAAADALRNGDLPTAFEEFGRISGEAVKLAFGFIKESVESVNWGEIGTLIASFINGINWQGVSDAFFGSITAVINAAIDLVYNFITETDWLSLGESLGTSISDALMSIDWAKAGQTVGEAFKAFFNFIAKTIENVDWYGLGQKVKEFLVNIDWNGVADSFFEAVGASIGGLAAFLWGIIEEAWNNVVQWWHDTAYEDGEFTIQGLLNGISDALRSINDWIIEHIVEPFLTGFRNAFGIHSPSTVMQEMGTFLIQGLLNGINSLVGNVKQVWESMKQTAVSVWNDVKQKTSNIVKDINSSISNTMSSVKVSWNNAWSSMGSKVSSVMNSVKNALNSAVNWIGNKVQNIKNKIDSLWEKAQDFFGGSGSGKSFSMGSGLSNYVYSSSSISPYTANPAFAALSTTPIPRLATGAVIPANKEFLAVLGDQKHGTNVEAPLDTIRQAAEEAVLNVFSKIGMSGGNMGGTPVNLTLQVALDSQVLGQKMVEWGKLQQMATGGNPYGLGTT